MTQDSSSLIEQAELKKRLMSNSEKIKNFDKLLNDIESIDDKKKALWREIYENALEDRENAYAMFSKLVHIVEDKSTEHAIHSRTIAQFLERMNKSNDQLLKLADLIARSQKQNEEINEDFMYSQISK